MLYTQCYDIQVSRLKYYKQTNQSTTIPVAAHARVGNDYNIDPT